MSTSNTKVKGAYYFFNPDKTTNFFSGSVPTTFEELQSLEEKHGVLSTMLVTDDPKSIATMVNNEYDGVVNYFGPFGEIRGHQSEYETLEAAIKDGADYEIASDVKLDAPRAISAIKESAINTARMYGHNDLNTPFLYIVVNGENLGRI